MENLPTTDNPTFLDNNYFKLNFFKKNIILYIIGIILFLVFFYFLFFTAPSGFPIGIIFNIKETISLRAISKDLETNKIIHSRAIFETLVIILGGEKHILPGDYLFESELSVFEVARRISKGDRNLALVKVTIPEGFDVLDISKTFISKLPNFNKDKFLLEAMKKEGYLFPDTYFFSVTDNEKDVLKSMNNNFEKRMMSIRSQLESSGNTQKDIIIMASILEKESKGDNDREVISGILWKRLAIGMPLQVDADFSTYKTKGLPKNPICNPGMEAINAAIHPKTSDYLYYLHDKDGNIHYAKTFADHILNKKKYLK